MNAFGLYNLGSSLTTYGQGQDLSGQTVVDRVRQGQLFDLHEQAEELRLKQSQALQPVGQPFRGSDGKTYVYRLDPTSGDISAQRLGFDLPDPVAEQLNERRRYADQMVSTLKSSGHWGKMTVTQQDAAYFGALGLNVPLVTRFSAVAGTGIPGSMLPPDARTLDGTPIPQDARTETTRFERIQGDDGRMYFDAKEPSAAGKRWELRELSGVPYAVQDPNGKLWAGGALDAGVGPPEAVETWRAGKAAHAQSRSEKASDRAAAAALTEKREWNILSARENAPKPLNAASIEGTTGAYRARQPAECASNDRPKS